MIKWFEVSVILQNGKGKPIRKRDAQNFPLARGVNQALRTASFSGFVGCSSLVQFRLYC